MLQHEIDHAGRAASRLAEQFKVATKFRAVIDAVCAQIQELEDAFWTCVTDRGLSGAGVQLDVLGRLLGEERAGDDDDRYILRLRARIRVLRSSGSAPNILKVFKLMLPDNVLRFDDASFHGGGFILDLGLVSAGDVPTYARFAHQAKSAGVNAQLLYQLDEDDNMFTLDDANDPGSVTAGLGLDDVNTPGSGGKLAAVIKSVL